MLIHVNSSHRMQLATLGPAAGRVSWLTAMDKEAVPKYAPLETKPSGWDDQWARAMWPRIKTDSSLTANDPGMGGRICLESLQLVTHEHIGAHMYKHKPECHIHSPVCLQCTHSHTRAHTHTDARTSQPAERICSPLRPSHYAERHRHIPESLTFLLLPLR